MQEFLGIFEKMGQYTMRVCVFEGRLRVACSLLYPIFKIGNFWGGSTQ